jgi:hypothetical protein
LKTGAYSLRAQVKFGKQKLKDGFLRVFKELAVSLALQVVGRDPGYAERFRTSIQVAVGTLESEAVRRAHEGVRKPVFYKGEHVRDSEGRLVYETEYGSNLLMFLLSAYDPNPVR